MNVLIIEPGHKPYEKNIDPSLDSLQAEVGGYIEALYPFSDPVALICNEEGKLNGLPLNRALYGDTGVITDIIAGTFIIAGLGEEDFDSLTPELMSKYKKIYESPEIFINTGRGIFAVPSA